ncbi:YadA C-terminal domain-containing protein [Fusobacterium necrophorum]|uniref:YadA C-terminal domain-containing protein n=2 Tax=Fusobacterium necrophorum TaxID=859 RepID=UPI000AD262CB|nr:YadA C-terminal domain-containing protein [Fusobacterium necrophorum]
MVKKSIFLVGVVLGLFTMTGELGLANPLKENLKAKDLKGNGKCKDKRNSYALPSKVAKAMNKTNKRVNNNSNKIDTLEHWLEYVDKDLSNVEDLADKNKENIKKEEVKRKEADTKHDRDIENNKKLIDAEVTRSKEADTKHDRDIAANSSAIKHLDSKVNKGTSMLVAMSNVDFKDVNAEEVAVGAGIGHYVGEQAVAVGIAYGVSDDLKVHAKWSGVAGDPHYNAIGGGVTYKFRTR